MTYASISLAFLFLCSFCLVLFCLLFMHFLKNSLEKIAHFNIFTYILFVFISIVCPIFFLEFGFIPFLISSFCVGFLAIIFINCYNNMPTDKGLFASIGFWFLTISFFACLVYFSLAFTSIINKDKSIIYILIPIVLFSILIAFIDIKSLKVKAVSCAVFVGLFSLCFSPVLAHITGLGNYDTNLVVKNNEILLQFLSDFSDCTDKISKKCKIIKKDKIILKDIHIDSLDARGLWISYFFKDKDNKDGKSRSFLVGNELIYYNGFGVLK